MGVDPTHNVHLIYQNLDRYSKWAKSDHSIYYLPGHGGRLTTGLGEALTQRGLAIVGRETVDEFLALPFLEQVALVADDLQANFWSPNAVVIANSFGAYLFLHAQASI